MVHLPPNLWKPSAVGKPIWSLASGYSDARRRRHRLWMLEAYFDDSGRGNGPVFVLGGFLSTAERWASFNEEWQSALDRDPPLKRFKMQHAMTGSEEWRSWSYETRFERLDLFHAIITRHVELGFAFVVHNHAFDRLKKIGAGLTDTIYPLVFMGVIMATMMHHKENCMTNKVDFVFDDQKHEFPQALTSFLKIWESDDYLQKYLAGTPRSASDDEVLPLQASDYLVWQLRRALAQKCDPTMPFRKLLISESHGGGIEIPIMVNSLDEKHLRQLSVTITREQITSVEKSDVDAEFREYMQEHLAERLRNLSE